MWLLDIIKVIILGIVEGITEWLPVSSTGHMILVDEFLQLNQSAEFKEMFLVVIQLGAILAVVIMFFNKLNPFSKKKTKDQQKDTINMWLKVIVGVIPAGVLGVLFDKTLEKYFYNFPTVAFTLVLYGILFIVVENNPKFKKQNIKRFEDLTLQDDFMFCKVMQNEGLCKTLIEMILSDTIGKIAYISIQHNINTYEQAKSVRFDVLVQAEYRNRTDIDWE